MAKLPAQPGVSRRQYALSRNVSEAAIRKHIASGTLAGAVLPNGNIDPDAADKLLAGSVTRGPKVPIQVRTAKARRIRAQIRLLYDEVMEIKNNVVTPADAAMIQDVVSARIIKWLRVIPDRAAAAAAGLPGDRAYRALDDCINNTLQDYQDDLPPEKPSTPTPEIDLAAMTPTELTALQLNLQAEKLEYERALNHGVVAWPDDLMPDYNEKLAVSKSMLLAIPGRVTVFMEGSSVEEARARIAEEIERVVAALH